jgi:hypothetical protein
VDASEGQVAVVPASGAVASFPGAGGGAET